jgi:hypothetical protein
VVLQPKQLFWLKNSYKYLNFLLLNLSFSSSRDASAKTSFWLKNSYKYLNFILLNLSFSSSRGASAKTAVMRG